MRLIARLIGPTVSPSDEAWNVIRLSSRLLQCRAFRSLSMNCPMIVAQPSYASERKGEEHIILASFTHAVKLLAMLVIYCRCPDEIEF